MTPHSRQEFADQKSGIPDCVFILLPQILIAAVTERIGIQVDHVPVDETVEREYLQKAVNPPVAQVPGQGEKEVEFPQRAYSLENLFL